MLFSEILTCLYMCWSRRTFPVTTIVTRQVDITRRTNNCTASTYIYY